MSKPRNSYKSDGTRYTPAEWRAMALDARRRSQESWERSDTDGFLSQWASDLSARELDDWATLAEHDYRWSFQALFDLAGNMLDAREVDGQYGRSWMIRTPQGTKWFSPSKARKAATRFANDSAKGYRIGYAESEAVCVMAGGASYMSVRPVYEAKWGADRTPVDPGTLGAGHYETDW